MLIDIRNRWTNEVIYSTEAESLKAAVEEGVRLSKSLDGANLDGANLYGASLDRANLRGANLDRANLRGANLRGANLDGANLDGANLDGARLFGANLYGASLDRANLRGARLDRANLRGANLYGASLRGANLYGASLFGANLYGASLFGANLDRANLDRSVGAELAIARTRILPEGSIIGYKKVSTPDGSGIVVLRIPAASRRSHAFGRKCRCEFAEVVEAPDGAYTDAHGPRTEYKVGEIVQADKWDEDWTRECSNGIHFFITRIEAENY